jgi:hypothetical protein
MISSWKNKSVQDSRLTSAAFVINIAGVKMMCKTDKGSGTVKNDPWRYERQTLFPFVYLVLFFRGMRAEKIPAACA